MVEESFNAAHQLKGYEGPCERLHGHTWKVEVHVSGEKQDKIGIIYDFKKMRGLLKGVLEDFDHNNLNDIAYFKGMNPTSENIAKVIYGRLKKGIGGGVNLSKVTVYESPTSSASYYE